MSINGNDDFFRVSLRVWKIMIFIAFIRMEYRLCGFELVDYKICLCYITMVYY